jgi:hypothetical protein
MLAETVADKLKSKGTIPYLLNSINVVECTILELSPSPRKQEVVTRNFNPVLVTLVLCKPGVWNIAVPYLQN